MSSTLQSVLKRISSEVQQACVKGIKRGVEKENLRVDATGHIAQTPHPQALGTTLTHPAITTDFSEALPELITPPVQGITELFDALQEIHSVTWQALQHEWLWPMSMPPTIQDPNEVILAQYGNSHIGQMKHVYRRGLCYRYGRIMQAIAGIHFNFSVPELLFTELKVNQSEQYMQLIRNFYQHYWVLAYLFGASPVCLPTSAHDPLPDYLHMQHDLVVGEYATSLRMSGLGYQNALQAGLDICYNHVDTYADSLLQATQTPFAAFTEIGVKVEGQYRQLNDSVLQIENEFYSPIRPKQPTRSGEMPALALKRRGIEYIEVRALDLNPLLPLGMDEAQVAFMDILLMLCLLQPCAEITPLACREAKANFTKVVQYGRQPGLVLHQNQQAVPMFDMAQTLFEQLQVVAEWMDEVMPESTYQSALQRQWRKVADVELTPSAQIMMALNQQSFTEYAMQLAHRHADYFAAHPLLEGRQQYYADMAQQSLQAKAEMEANDQGTFDQFLAQYFAQIKEAT